MIKSKSADVILDIDLAAIQENFVYMKSLTAPGVTNAAVVKSDAYGLGLKHVATALEQAGCRFFFVADIDEAVQLRSVCPTVKIATFRGDLAKHGAVYKHHRITPVLNTVNDIDLAVSHALASPYIIHLDTGLTRLGLSSREITSLYLSGRFLNIPRMWIISHLGCGAQPASRANELQRQRFEAIYQQLKPFGGGLAASAGVWLGPSYHFDMVRLGSALFGMNDPRIRPNPLQPVLHLSAPIVEVRDIPWREAVGYAATFRTRRASRIAVLGIGYKHGLPWSCANTISARIGEFKAPLVGRISMEYTTVDVTHIPETICHPEARVSLLDDEFGLDDMADAIGGSSQETMLRLGACCRRRYTALKPEINKNNALAPRRFMNAAPFSHPLPRHSIGELPTQVRRVNGVIGHVYRSAAPSKSR